MPELPEVEIVCRGLNQLTCNRTITGGSILLKSTISYPPLSQELFWDSLTGVHIVSWTRRGKYLIGCLSNKKGDHCGFLAIHLRMTGQLLFVEQDEPISKHTRVRFFFGESQELRFVDIRTFGKIWLIPAVMQPETVIFSLKNLGVEPLSVKFTTDYLIDRLDKSNSKIKNILLDQKVIAGIGNIYADESLFESRIHPKSPASCLTIENWQDLQKAIVKVLKKGIEQGGTTIRDFRTVTGINGNYGGVAWVYGRTGKPCRICDTPIEKITLGGRSSHFCPRCQPISIQPNP